jgi:hypothetical protein
MGFSICRAFWPGGCHSYNEGGESGKNFGRFWFVWARDLGVSLKFHWRLESLPFCPTTATV